LSQSVQIKINESALEDVKSDFIHQEIFGLLPHCYHIWSAFLFKQLSDSLIYIKELFQKSLE